MPAAKGSQWKEERRCQISCYTAFCELVHLFTCNLLGLKNMGYVCSTWPL
uniref:Uncharacterized protein n=1 Tax=Anguilla anguilla TaxID=7936 RepID=A0A0E9RUU4_ANGAN